ncbi:EamA family transporter [Staphylococcus epidermidis]|nr:EamA family transporter [Staphylococcus epidermidis]
MAAKQNYEPGVFCVWTSIFPIIPLLLLSWWMEGGDAMLVQLQAMGWRELGVIAYLAFLSLTLLGYGLWTRLLQRYAASTVAPLSLVPVIGLPAMVLLEVSQRTTVAGNGVLGMMV